MSRSLLVRRFLWITVFAVAMGFLESAVVVYLRALYYPEGFDFPVKVMNDVLARTELWREAATMVMLASMAAVVSRRFTEGLAWFIFAFAVWDIFYYVFLRLLIGWPSSLATWDLLFLLPVMWTGPVYAPLLNSLTMILLSVLILRAYGYHEQVRFTWTEWLLLAAGIAVTLTAYTADYMGYILKQYDLIALVTPAAYPELMEYSSNYIPATFSVGWFITGEVLFLLACGLFYYRNRS